MKKIDQYCLHFKDIGIKMHKANCLLERVVVKTLKRLSLPFPNFKILMALRYRRRVTQKDIAHFHGLTEAAISRRIEELVSDGIIKLVTNPDNRREHLLKLTAKGEHLAERSQILLGKKLNSIFSIIPDKQQHILNQSLDSLITSLDS
jgi:DNA-binding MarR family transcriptional regulator